MKMNNTTHKKATLQLNSENCQKYKMELSFGNS